MQTLIKTFESDWTDAISSTAAAPVKDESLSEPLLDESPRERDATAKETERAVQVFTKELDPLSDTVKAVRKAVEKAAEDVLDVLDDKDVKATMKKVVKGSQTSRSGSPGHAARLVHFLA